MTLNFNFNETRFDSNAAEPEYLKMRHLFNPEPERSVFGQLNKKPVRPETVGERSEMTRVLLPNYHETIAAATNQI